MQSASWTRKLLRYFTRIPQTTTPGGRRAGWRIQKMWLIFMARGGFALVEHWTLQGQWAVKREEANDCHLSVGCT